MQESAQQTEEFTIAKPAAIEEQDPARNLKYDPESNQTFEFEAKGADGHLYDTTHVFKPITDDRYLKWIGEFKFEVKNDQVEETTREATIALWDDLIIEVKNIEFPEDADWKALIPIEEKISSIQHYLSVVIFDGDKRKGARRLTSEAQITVYTDCWMNGEVSRQQHILKEVTIEHQKKYVRILNKRFQEEKTRGLRRKPKMEYLPQNKAFGDLYDEMCISHDGFTTEVPLRFKETVIGEIFDSGLKEKKSSPNAQS